MKIQSDKEKLADHLKSIPPQGIYNFVFLSIYAFIYVNAFATVVHSENSAHSELTLLIWPRMQEELWGLYRDKITPAFIPMFMFR
jgi:hypothetical protein